LAITVIVPSYYYGKALIYALSYMYITMLTWLTYNYVAIVI